MQIKLGNWEAKASEKRISFEGGTIETPTGARILADMLHRWADAFEDVNGREPFEQLLEQLGPELVEWFQQMIRESQAREGHFTGAARRRDDLN